jgi:hypothetical protein
MSDARRIRDLAIVVEIAMKVPDCALANVGEVHFGGAPGSRGMVGEDGVVP